MNAAFRLFLALVCACWFVGAAGAQGDALADATLRVRGEAWPGGALFVSVETQAPNPTGTWTWAGRSGAMTAAPYGLRTGLAIPLDAAQGGTATLKVDVSAGGQTRTLTRRFTIEKKWRPVQYLSMSADDAAKYEDPELDREYEEIGEALARVTPGALWSGPFRTPAEGPAGSPFGVKRIRNGEPAGFHRGLDISAWEGSPVVAPAEGIVALTGRGYILHGNTVILDHGEGLTTLYIHLSEITCREGERVQAGDMIGRVGSTGASTGPHLHYAAYFHGVPIDPALLRHIPAAWASAGE